MEKDLSIEHFHNIDWLELIGTVLAIGIGIFLFKRDFTEINVINLIYKLDGICFILAGLIGAKGAVFRNKNIPVGEIYCWANGRGPYTLFNNIAYGILAIILVFAMVALNFNDCGGVVVFSIAANLLIIHSMFGVFYRNTNCIIVVLGHLYKMHMNKVNELELDNMIAYTNSIRFAGFKLIDEKKENKLNWSVYWDNGDKITKYFDEQQIEYRTHIGK